MSCRDRPTVRAAQRLTPAWFQETYRSVAEPEAIAPMKCCATHKKIQVAALHRKTRLYNMPRRRLMTKICPAAWPKKRTNHSSVMAFDIA